MAIFKSLSQARQEFADKISKVNPKDRKFAESVNKMTEVLNELELNAAPTMHSFIPRWKPQVIKTALLDGIRIIVCGTTLTDSEGTEVYEGHILEDADGNRLTPAWVDGGYQLQRYDAPHTILTNKRFSDCKIIGAIWNEESDH